MDATSARLKRFLNDQANRRLAQLGYSEPMVRDAKREAWWWLQARGGAIRSRTRLIGGCAVVWTTSGRADLLDIEVPMPRRGEVTVEVLTSAVSAGTERAQYLRLPNARISYPHRPGYSVAGRVLAVGSGVPLDVGELVAARGVTHASVATIAADAVHRVPDGVAPAAAALVQLGVICGQGVEKAELRPGERVVVIGSGAIGLLAQRLAVARGAGETVVVATSRQKEPTARAGGASRFLLAGADADEIAGLGAPVVVEATGDPSALALAVAAAADRGRIVLLGSSRGTTAAVPHDELRSRELTLVGAHVETLASERRRIGVDLHRREGERFLALLAEARIDVADLLQAEIDPREADDFYRSLARRRDLVSARFDWTALPREARLRSARLLRAPDIRARGSDPQKAPLPAHVPPAPSGDRRPPSSRGLRIGLVGCGDIAVHNAAAVAAVPNASLTASFDPVAELARSVADEWGGEAVTSVEALLDRSDVDAVFLAVPHHLHAPLAVQAAAAGKHVIVEKPMANDLAGALEMTAAAERAGVVLSVCLPHRYEAGVAATRRLIAAGAIGEPRGTRTTFYEDKPASYWLGGFSGRAVSSWRSSRAQAGGGLLIMNLSHLIDLARYLTDVEVDSLSAVCDAADGPAEVEDTISVTIRYANGGVGTLSGSSALRGNRGRPDELHVWGPGGYLEVEPSSRLYTTRAADNLATGRWQTLAGLPEVAIRQQYVMRLADAILRGAPPDVTAADGLAVQAFIEAAYRSSETGEVIRVASLLAQANTAGSRAAA
jgi:predicted dehydrogenase/threonine dehydrogenase-like Zn-dependent dehydrogenase